MKKDQSIALDLRVARQKAGLRQLDCAHLLGVTASRVSHFETGQSLPTAKQVLALSIVYGKPTEAVVAGMLDEIVDGLVKQLKTGPRAPQETTETFNRAHTLSQLAIRLEALTTARHGG